MNKFNVNLQYNVFSHCKEDGSSTNGYVHLGKQVVNNLYPLVCLV